MGVAAEALELTRLWEAVIGNGPQRWAAAAFSFCWYAAAAVVDVVAVEDLTQPWLWEAGVGVGDGGRRWG